MWINEFKLMQKEKKISNENHYSIKTSKNRNGIPDSKQNIT